MRLEVLVLVLALVSASAVGTRAESASIRDAAAVQAVSGIVHPRPATTLTQTPQRNRCNAKRRVLIGAAVGAAIGMVAVRKAAEANDGTVGAKTTLQAGTYGAALGAVIGLATCR
jgi:hypothetical protein